MRSKGTFGAVAGVLLLLAALTGCTTAPGPAPLPSDRAGHAGGAGMGALGDMHEEHGASPSSSAEPTVTYALRAALPAFFDAGDGDKNPRLTAHVGDVVRVTLVNGEDIAHDFVVPDLGVHSAHVERAGDRAVVTFDVAQPGTHAYLCSVPGHREAGMDGVLDVLQA